MVNKKQILLVAPYLTFPNEPGANRFITLASMLAKDYDVTLVTSRFSHFLKSQRHEAYPLESINVVLIDEPGYRTNVSVDRLYSHRIFCQNFDKYLQANGHQFDLVYSAYPLIYTNYLLGKNKQKFGYQLVMDIQDIWPDSIMGPIAFFSTPFGKPLLKPVNSYADKTYGYADALVAVSHTYLDKADVKRLPENKKAVVYIGANNAVQSVDETKYQDINRPLIATYIGTIGGSYDLETVIKAAPLCDNNINIQIIGGGPDEARLRALNESLGGRVAFLGSMAYDDAMKVLSASDVAINAIKSVAQQSITNKLSDYFCCGLPIVSCQENKEVKELLNQGGGLQYQASNPESLAKALYELAAHREQLLEMSRINVQLAKERFWRPKSYLNIVKLVASMLNP